MKNVNKWSLDDVKAIVNRVSELDENYGVRSSEDSPALWTIPSEHSISAIRTIRSAV